MSGPSTVKTDAESTPERPLSLDEYERYGRQMIMPGWGLPGQLRLKQARVAVVGAGGLGCPVLQYLAGTGVGTIEIFDHDLVSKSNLHRQILHTTERIGMSKAVSASLAMQSLNPNVRVIPREEAIQPSTALARLRDSDIIIDCTDRPMTRYLLNDAAVRLGKPLVSGAAISSAGQWAVYGGSAKGQKRACYRCLWPALLPGAAGRCEDVGVWGVVTGMVGTGMASEVIKLLLGNEDPNPLLHIFHLGGVPLVRTIKMKPPSPKCKACGPDATITDDLAEADYDEFCEAVLVDELTGEVVGAPGERVGAKDFASLIGKGDVIVVDTRPEIEYGIASIPHTLNIPLDRILSNPLEVPTRQEVIFLCRQGNDSQLAASALRAALTPDTPVSTGEALADGAGAPAAAVPRVRDVRGGLRAWARDVDPSFPLY
ncbi:Urmylation protein [Saitozyma podzolica]|uniref:Urmylation protein n=1 Tax=Saitozyma podzolica TaxID=1890683 RepID=A0A427XYJ5_9TREE|nr:Urmylation protein [Saitozyma podzolica]